MRCPYGVTALGKYQNVAFNLWGALLFELGSTTEKKSVEADYFTRSESACPFYRLANIDASIKNTVDHVNLVPGLSEENGSMNGGTNDTELATI